MTNLDISKVKPIVEDAAHSYDNQSTHLLQILWKIQDQFGYIPPVAMECLAEILGVTATYIESVISFYSFFYSAPRGEYNILFSDNIIEWMQDKQRIMSRLMGKLGVQPGKVRGDGIVTIDNTSCIGMSDQGPAALINGYPLTRLSKAKVDEIVELIETRTPLSAWPKEYFVVKDNIRRKGFLLNEDFTPGAALKASLEQGAEASLELLNQSGLRGCGGAGFKLATKWTLCRNTTADQRFVVCNADEGEPGTYKDRVLLQNYADLVFEGMTLCGHIIGAHKGFLYLRGEYRYLFNALEMILAKRREQGLLGKHILGNPDFNFDIEICLGAGAYICGAEMSLLESLEGKRGTHTRRAPPYPVNSGYLGKPTVVNNVETLAFAAKILANGIESFTTLGTTQSKGSKLLSISGDCDRPGIYEFPFGTTIREVLQECGAQEVRAVQNSGPAGTCVAENEFDRRLCFEDLNTTGSFMIFNRSRDMLEVVRNFANFFVHESCGFCTPCRVGTSIIKNLVDKIYQGNGTRADLDEMENLSQVIKTTSNCGLGYTAANHITDTLKKFPHIYERRLKDKYDVAPSFNLDAALEEARLITHRDDEEAHIL